MSRCQQDHNMAESTKIAMVKRLMEEIMKNTFDIGSSLWVDVLQINNPHDFYIRPKTYSKYMPLLEARGSKPELSDIHIGDVYIFKSTLLKCFVRGKVISVEHADEEANCRLFAIDNGYFEGDVPLKRLWKTQLRVQVPPLARHCQLADCTPKDDTWDEQAIDAMKSYVEGERAKMIVRSKQSDTLIVELYNSCPDDIATLLALTDYSTFGYTDTSVNRFASPRIPEKNYALRKLEEDMTIHVQMQSGTFIDQFFVTPIDEYPSYLSDRDSFSAHVRCQPSLPRDMIKVNTPVGLYLCSNNKFERGIVKVVLPESDRAVVQLVDQGKVIEDALIKMKAVPDWSLRIPPRAICCVLHHSQPYDQKVATMTQPGTEFMIDIKTVAHDNWSPNQVVVSLLKD